MLGDEACTLRQGRLRILRKLGEGGMGEIHEAVNVDNQARLAVKTLRRISADGLQRFKTEFRSLQDLEHPNLIRLGELFEEDGHWHFTMELVEGQNFVHYVRVPVDAAAPTERCPMGLRTAAEKGGFAGTLNEDVCTSPAMRKGPFDEPRLRFALRQLVDAVNALHMAGKVHRDIKPSNILVTPEGRLVLLDFGVVKETIPGERSVTPGMAIIGTAEYMAPEQAAGKHVGPEADWYSVGTLIYEALTGEVPFTGGLIQIVLAKQTQVPPSPKTLVPEVPSDLDSLCMDLLKILPECRASGVDVMARLDAASQRSVSLESNPDLKRATLDSIFVGRQHELVLLVDGFETVRREGRAVAVIVGGESGIGKTSLLRHFTKLLKSRTTTNLACLFGRCYQREALPYKGLDGVIDSLGRFLIRLGDKADAILPLDAALLGSAFPVLRRVRSIEKARDLAHPDSDDPKRCRARLFACVRELFCRLAERYAIVIVIDDIQWADPDSIALLQEIIRPPEAPALFLSLTWRTNASPRVQFQEWLNALSRCLDCRRLTLVGLASEAGTEMASHLATHLSDGVKVDALAIAEEAMGHPMFIQELVSQALALRQSSADGFLKLDDALLHRIRFLPHRARVVLELVALAGFPISTQTIANAAGLTYADADGDMAVLRSGRLIRRTWSDHEEEVQTYQDRIREAAISTIDTDTLRQHHNCLAQALEKQRSVDPEQLAVHWNGAGKRECAADYLMQAAANAKAALAFGHAAELIIKALELREASSNPSVAVQIELAEVLANAGRGEESGEAYLLAASLMDSGPEVFEIQRRATAEFLRSGHIKKGIGAIRSVLVAMKISLPPTPLRVLSSLLYRRAWLRLRGLHFRLRQECDVDVQLLGHIDACVSVASGLGNTDNIRGADFNTRALLLALKAGEPARLAQALATEAIFVSSQGVAARARTDALLEASRKLYDQLTNRPLTRA